ncbi:hypothetical protein GCM10010840_36900 [Deinococcus aerolatus]|uniref:Uncharacterized protein n=1 Tax=Deinococcus aerolatus TaxID=522487 RepID=A0ABQ2GHC7_9DEIO|nr:hypothetical protein [Deinococcus aerolatus]GGL95445.1 hypothetical protein GCM10010840_36900 [Deinococcus aerolatus]
MRLPELTPTELADLLARAYAADHGEPRDALSAADRIALADYLGCHEEVRAAAFAVWCQELDGVTEDEAAYWLDVEFVEPCHEERSVYGMTLSNSVPRRSSVMSRNSSGNRLGMPRLAQRRWAYQVLGMEGPNSLGRPVYILDPPRRLI